MTVLNVAYVSICIDVDKQAHIWKNRSLVITYLHAVDTENRGKPAFRTLNWR